VSREIPNSKQTETKKEQRRSTDDGGGRKVALRFFRRQRRLTATTLVTPAVQLPRLLHQRSIGVTRIIATLRHRL